jgi:hypothetical protein
MMFGCLVRLLGILASRETGEKECLVGNRVSGSSIAGKFSVAKKPLDDNMKWILKDTNYLLRDMRQSIERDYALSWIFVQS